MHNSKNIGTQSIRELCWNNGHKYQDHAVRENTTDSHQLLTNSNCCMFCYELPVANSLNFNSL